MKKISFLIFLTFLSPLVKAGGDTIRPQRQKYIDEHKDDAIRDMLKTGVPASITLAQALLESHDGCSALAREANNHFGIKCSDWNGPSYIQDDDKKDECFRKYRTTLESYDDHSLFLRTRPRYASLFELELTDYKGWAHGLKKAGYATDPSYASRLIKIIEENQLYLLDQAKEPEYLASLDPQTEEASVTKPSRSTTSNIKKIYVPSVDVVDALTLRKIKSINGVDCIMARKGDDLKSIAKEMKMGYWQLPRYNEMKADEQLEEGQIIYIQPKKKTGLSAVYTVKPGDTVFSIAQANAVKSKYIYKYNSGLKEGTSLEPGQQLYLKRVK